MTSHGRVSVASTRHDGTGIFDPPSPITKHEKFPTSSTEGDIITPAQSLDDLDKLAKGGDEIHMNAWDQEDEAGDKDGDLAEHRDKRLSTISTATVTFG
jgi:hypothetical protein